MILRVAKDLLPDPEDGTEESRKTFRLWEQITGSVRLLSYRHSTSREPFAGSIVLLFGQTQAGDAAREGRKTEGIGTMMFLWSSLIAEQRSDACFAGQPANTLPVRSLRL